MLGGFNATFLRLGVQLPLRAGGVSSLDFCCSRVKLMLVYNPGKRHATQVVDIGEEPASSVSTSTKVTYQNFPPFVKDFFLGRFNRKILSYAEVLNYDRHYALEDRVIALREFLDSKQGGLSEVSRTGKIPHEVLFSLKKMGLYGLTGPIEFGGEDLMATELAKIFEELGRSDLSLSETLSIHQCLGYKAIAMHGTDLQKETYLPDLISGESLATFCLTEASCGSDPNSCKSVAAYDDQDDYYVLNGTKTWVAHGNNADVFTVFAQTVVQDYMGEDVYSLTAFVIDKTFNGIEVSEPYDMGGFKGLEACSVTFNNTIVPKTAVLGEIGDGINILLGIMHRNKYLSGAAIVGNLRELLTKTIEHTQLRRQYGKQLADFELIKLQLAKMAGKLYALESMVYMTAGLADVSQDPDIDVESAMTKQFAVETSDFVVKTCLNILGADATLESSPFQKYIKENHALQYWQGTGNITKFAISISGIQHAIEQNGGEVVKTRHFLMNPYKYVKHAWDSRKHLNDTFHKFPLELEKNVHPVFVESAKQLEYSVVKFGWIVKELLMREGANIQIQEGQLERLSDISMEIYAMTCVLSRSSRAYVVGHLHGEHELQLAKPFIWDASLRVRSLVNSCLTTDNMRTGNMDEYWLDAANYMCRRGAYLAVSPITKNSF